MRKVIVNTVSIILILAVMFSSHSVGNASTYSNAEYYVSQAESYAGALKWQISVEFTQKIQYPDMQIFNLTKDNMLKAKDAISKLPKGTYKSKLEERLRNNVVLHYSRATAYIDAITSGKKITTKTEDFLRLFDSNPLSDEAEQAYHSLSSEIRKQAILLYRVYGKSTRQAILDLYKTPGQSSLNNTLYSISTKMALEKLYEDQKNNASEQQLSTTVTLIKSLIPNIEQSKVKEYLNTHIETLSAVNVINEFTNSLLEGLTYEKSKQHSKYTVTILSYNKSNKLFNQGSGVVVGSQYILTSYQVVQGGHSLSALSNGGKRIEIEGVVKHDINTNLVLLKTKNLFSKPYAKIGSQEMVKKGGSLISIGTFDGYPNTVTNHEVNSIHEYTYINGVNYTSFFLTFPYSYGISGGPILTMDGHLVAIALHGTEVLFRAIPVDYATSWINEVNSKSSANVGTIPVNKLPKDPTHVTGNVTVENPFSRYDGLTTSSSKFYLKDIIRNAVIHPTKPIIYGISGNDKLLEINYLTKTSKELSFNGIPGRAVIYGNELYVTILKAPHNPYWFDSYGEIMIINTDNFQIKDQFSVDIDPYDLLVNGKNIYVTPGSGQWDKFKSYNRETLLETSSISLSNLSTIAFLNNDTIWSYPGSLHSISLNDGKLVRAVNIDNHIGYGTRIYHSPDYRFIIGNSGYVASAKRVHPVPKMYEFEEISFALEKNLIFTSKDNYIDIYSTEDLLRKKRVPMGKDIHKLFYKDDQLIVISQENIGPTQVPSYVIEQHKISDLLK